MGHERALILFVFDRCGRLAAVMRGSELQYQLHDCGDLLRWITDIAISDSWIIYV
jgi:hypothetical protein